MKRLISAVLLSAAVVVPTMAKNAKTLGNGYPFTQVPFTSVKISQNTFWGARLKAAREVTVPLAFSIASKPYQSKAGENWIKLAKLLSLPVEMISQSSRGESEERIIRAVFPPTPETVMRCIRSIRPYSRYR